MVRGDKKRKVAVLGWYGHHNFGDELLLEGLRNLFKGWGVFPMTSNVTQNVPVANIEEINKCDLFVLGGGELIETDKLFVSNYNFYSSKVSRLFHKTVNRLGMSWVRKIKVPKVILGCGVNAENMDVLDTSVIEALKQFDYIGLRDSTSVEMLKGISSLADKVHLFHDLAFSVTFKKPKICSGGFAVVIPTDRFTSKCDRGIRQTLLSIKSKDWLKKRLFDWSKAVFVPFGQEDNDDYETCRLLSSCAGNSEIVNPKDVTLQNVVDLVAHANVVFSYRLHGLILAFMLRKKFEFYPYHWKLSRIYKTIKTLSVTKIVETQRIEYRKMLDCVFNVNN